MKNPIGDLPKDKQEDLNFLRDRELKRLPQIDDQIAGMGRNKSNKSLIVKQ